MRAPLALLLLLVASCAGKVDSPGDAAHVHFDISWHQTKDQTDMVQCHYFKTPNNEDVEVDRITVDFPTGSHHVHMYRSSMPAPDGVEDCTAGIDWNRWSLLVGVQTKPLDWQLPDGVTTPLPAHQQLLVQVHWLNLTGTDIDRTIHVQMHKAQSSKAHLGVAFGISKDTYMRPGEQKRVGAWVPVPSGTHLVAMMGHFHGRGTGYRADLRKQGEATGTLVYEAADEQTFEFKNYDATPPMPVIGDGQGIAYECDFTNDTSQAITWGPNTTSQEHCNMAAYYYPASDPPSMNVFTGDLDHVDPLPSTMFPGQSATSTVWLKQPAGPLPIEVAIDSSDPSVMAPSSVHVPAWGRSARFQIGGTRPGSLALSFTTGSDVLQKPAVIEGLALSEVYYQPSEPGPGQQWIEVANIGDAPIDLSRFSIGAGSSSYGVTRVALGDRMLPPAGCLVVGGPFNLPVEDPGSLLFVRPVELSPLLATGDVAAAGVGLFDAPIGMVAPGALPFDAVVYGAANTNQLPAGGGGIAVPVPGAPTGASLERTANGWTVQHTPTPGICRLPHAL
jgi:hypothetical protein